MFLRIVFPFYFKLFAYSIQARQDQDSDKGREGIRIFLPLNWSNLQNPQAPSFPKISFGTPRSKMAAKGTIRPALIIVDMQEDFCPPVRLP
jgi:hypothetical protein